MRRPMHRRGRPDRWSLTSEVVDPLLGKVIDGRFRILSLLAQAAGMGRVYRAEQVQLGRICARLKVLHPKYTGDRDPEFARRFFLEAKVASQLTHPNTVTIFDYGQDKEEDIFFMAMELLGGVDPPPRHPHRRAVPAPSAWRTSAGSFAAACARRTASASSTAISSRRTSSSRSTATSPTS